ncbi:CRISPR-associated helicase, Cas3 family [Lampropedia hyalina DSM 16112]|jgi:CRISPR-associated endonuclease/helicase Cas3|uniref:CRISPR-associated helicase, Cas3 family n=1 Tax=Lampropedia hyalina DSM 16112 TaxID=1122156 RepID=A0A1M4XZ20_9BURK|nr:type I-F CRISPR-associated helicase Cas3f [Lampropedia hyalina]SHE98586.1 CRISPR-associated helicase, Cas3 family [Lampropedia hyalina DSM 16112]
MNILLISQCHKNALTETRRILDQFAERRGERTWQTAITQAGLDTLRKLLRQSARKNTAVACHWIRGKDHSELLWIVGDARQFNAEGAVPTHTTARNVLRADDENTWHSLRTIQSLTALAALMHDLGKASDAFQARLAGKLQEKNLYRHEWTSVRLFQAFVASSGDSSSDQAWLQQLATCAELTQPDAWEQQHWRGAHLLCDGLNPAISRAHNPLHVLPPLAQAVAWLILAHHRLPAVPYSASEVRGADARLWHGRIFPIGQGDLAGLLGRINAEWNEPCAERDTRKLKPYWAFRHGLPVTSQAWRKRVARVAGSLLQTCAPSPTPATAPAAPLQDGYIMHMARLSLMLGDHYYSSLTAAAQRVKGDENHPLFANTDRTTGKQLQRLDEHLLGVESHASQIVHTLPSLSRQLAHLQGHKRLKMRSSLAQFRWQDKAADLAASVRQHSLEHGAFIVNMASTGCGKTLANARIMNALAEPARGMRCAFAIGLRTLTLQTGRSFQHDLGLGEDALAIQVGGMASRELFEHYESLHEQSGSASRQELLDETTHVVFEGNDQHPVLHHLGHDSGARKLLAAPLLVCTVDHLTPATESLRGGHQIAPMLRLMTGDLVLDEPDDFDLDDLPALTRLVHWAGLLGSRVLLSSATLPPALVQGLFMAYLAGRRLFQQNRGPRPNEQPRICCLWVDEFAQSHAECGDAAHFAAQHQPFATQRAAKLAQQPLRRRAQLLALPPAWEGTLNQAQRRKQLAQMLCNAALALHPRNHSIDPHSGKRISFGLIRMANIAPLFDVALGLFQHGIPAGTRIHLCVYHSQFPLFVRSAIEHQLDTTLNRRQENAVFDLPDIRQAIAAHPEPDQLFIVLGSPVTEVGRDHDYDWAVVEPSSMRSLIQLAGRVLRHRSEKTITYPNLLVCDHNLRHFEQRNGIAYCKPGFESKDFTLESHHLKDLLSHLLNQQQMSIDARPRIVARPAELCQPHHNMVDLEHARMQWQMLPATQVRLNANSIWQHEHLHLTGALSQTQPFRHDTQRDVEVVLLPTEDEDDYRLCRVSQGEKKWQRDYDEWEGKNARIPEEGVSHPQISQWGQVDFMAAMHAQAEAMGLPLDQFAKRFTVARLTMNENNNQGWSWHPWLGFTRKD